MLQMINFDNNNVNNSPNDISLNFRDKPPQTANNFYKGNNPGHNQNNSNNYNEINENSAREKNNVNINLPKVKHLKRNNLNVSNDDNNNDMDNLENYADDGMQPKV